MSMAKPTAPSRLRTGKLSSYEQHDVVWETIIREVKEEADNEPLLASFLHATVLNHNTLEDALGFLLAGKMESSVLPAMLIRELIAEATNNEASIGEAIRYDLLAVRDRDPAAHHFSRPFLFYKGFQGIQIQRIAHYFWQHGRNVLALYLQSRISEIFGMDIHPAAKIGHGIMVDHATGLVVGETAVIGNNVSLLHGVTLGGTGKETGDRHPKIGEGVLIGATATILGNVTIGRCSKVGAGSVVVDDVPPKVTVVGVPAQIVGETDCDMPSMSMDQKLSS